ncbi:MAG: polysaccharide pyruvyl transferase family protein [Pseudomonadota bacterium]
MTESARQCLRRSIGETISDGPYAIIDFPNYANPGDSAIWVGARQLLETLFQRPPSYVSTFRHFNTGQCRMRTAGGTVFFLGGGNFGSLYGKHHQTRLNVLKQLADMKIVLLPLSVAEDTTSHTNSAFVSDTRAALDGCRNLKIFVREKVSRARFKEDYGFDSTLCPDTAHWCSLPNVRSTMTAIGLLRRDGEALKASMGKDLPIDATFDWSDIKSIKYLNRIGKASPLLLQQSLRLWAFDFFAERKTWAASRWLGRGDQVLTDRLHGVILASMMNRKVTAADNRTGKVASYVETWAKLLPRVSLQ